MQNVVIMLYEFAASGRITNIRVFILLLFVVIQMFYLLYIVAYYCTINFLHLHHSSIVKCYSVVKLTTTANKVIQYTDLSSALLFACTLLNCNSFCSRLFLFIVIHDSRPLISQALPASAWQLNGLTHFLCANLTKRIPANFSDFKSEWRQLWQETVFRCPWINLLCVWAGGELKQTIFTSKIKKK